MQGTRRRPALAVTTGARGVVAHAGARLLCDLADDVGLTEELSARRCRDPTESIHRCRSRCPWSGVAVAPRPVHGTLHYLQSWLILAELADATVSRFLEPMAQHRAIGFVDQSGCDVDGEGGLYAEEIGGVGGSSVQVGGPRVGRQIRAVTSAAGLLTASVERMPS